MRLFTYLPISRIMEIKEYFAYNINLIRSRLGSADAVVYLDNAFSCCIDIDHDALGLSNSAVYKYVDYGNRSETILSILSIAEPGDVIVDSDVELMPSFIDVYGKAHGFSAGLIGIADVGGLPGPRDVVFSGVPYTRILYNKRGHSPVFFGPKQAIIVNHKPRESVIELLMDVVRAVPRQLRNCIADETILGLYALMIGQSLTPWFPVAVNAGHGGDSCGRHARAYTHYLLFKILKRKGVHIEGLGLVRNVLRYFLSALIHW